MDQFRPELIPNPAVRRLSLYLRQLETFFFRHGFPYGFYKRLRRLL